MTNVFRDYQIIDFLYVYAVLAMLIESISSDVIMMGSSICVMPSSDSIASALITSIIYHPDMVYVALGVEGTGIILICRIPLACP